jgi:hypothetical protein
VHDPGKVLLDLALAVALGGDCLSDVAVPPERWNLTLTRRDCEDEQVPPRVVV